MPCYCDGGEELSQTEIRRRCKEGMYFHAYGLLDEEQKSKVDRFPLSYISEDLCKICKVMTKEQMMEVSAYYFGLKWPYRTLYDWYVQHTIDDEKHNKEYKLW